MSHAAFEVELAHTKLDGYVLRSVGVHIGRHQGDGHGIANICLGPGAWRECGDTVASSVAESPVVRKCTYVLVTGSGAN